MRSIATLEMEPLTTDEVVPPNPSAHPGAPHDSNGNCIHHPSVKLARLANITANTSDSISWIIERKRCPKCCLNSIIHDTARKTDFGQSFLSKGRSVTRSEARSVGGKSRYSYKPAGSYSVASVSVSCASLPQSFEEGLSNLKDQKIDGSFISGAESVSYFSRGGDQWKPDRSENGSFTERRDPRDIPFRTPKDPSAASSSITSRMSINRSNTSQTSESPSYKPALRAHTRGGHGRRQRDLSPESKNSTIGMSTIPTADASTCSTITMDTALFGRSQRRHHGSSRPFSSGLDPVRETDSRGRDPEEESRSLMSGDANGHVPTQVNVPEENEEKIVLICNLPRDIGQDQDVRSVRSKRSKDKVSRKKGDEPSSRDDYDLKRKDSRDTNKSSRRRSQSWGECEVKNNRSSRHVSRNQHSPRHKGDASYYSQPSVANSYSGRSVRSHNSRPSIRRDIDPNGYCSHHPGIRLMKPDEKDPSYWCVVRKKCPECIREDCPSVFADQSIGSYVSHRTPFYDNESMYSVESSKGSSFFHGTLQTPEEIEEEEDTRRLKRRLAARAYHFPGNTWCEDWFQYISNTHTVLGLFFHHPLHPLKLQERLVILFGSIAIGLTISNLTYMHFIKIGVDVDEELFRVNLAWMGMSEVIITKLMLTLWTLGSFLHTVFDLGLWHMKVRTRFACHVSKQSSRLHNLNLYSTHE